MGLRTNVLVVPDPDELGVAMRGLERIHAVSIFITVKESTNV